MICQNLERRPMDPDPVILTWCCRRAISILRRISVDWSALTWPTLGLEFYLSVLSIVIIDPVSAGDNAVVIRWYYCNGTNAARENC